VFADWALACFALATAMIVVTTLPISICFMTGALSMIVATVIAVD
jgi:hypothetical protein